MASSSAQDIMQLASDVERALRPIQPQLISFNLYDAKGTPMLESSFAESKYDLAVIGGLIAAINGFTGEQTENFNRLISFEEVHILYTEAHGYIFAVLTREISSDHAEENFLIKFKSAFEHAYILEKDKENREKEENICISILRIYMLIDDALHPHHSFGSTVSYSTSELEQLASKSNQEEFEQKRKIERAKLENLQSTVDEELAEEEVHNTTIQNPKQALDNLITRFVEKFQYVEDFRILKPDPDLGIESIHKSKLSNDVANKVYSVILENYRYITQLLKDDTLDNMIELEDKFVVFQSISEYSFIYIVISDKKAIEIVDPIIKRIATTIATLFPE